MAVLSLNHRFIIPAFLYALSGGRYSLEFIAVLNAWYSIVYFLTTFMINLASFPGHCQILSRSGRDESGEGLGPLLHHGLEIVDSVSTN